MATALIGLGSNLGDRSAALDTALCRLAAVTGVEILRHSRAAEYPSVGGPPGQQAYLNSAALLRTALPPEAMLALLGQVERELGRTREARWGPRTIDLDLLLYDDQVIETPTLTVPHPRLAVRRFVLEPAAEIAADMVHPAIGWTVGRLLAHLNAHPRYVALAGPTGVGKTRLAQEIAVAVADRFGVPCRNIEETINDELLAQFYADPAGRGPAAELEFLRTKAPLVTDVGGQRDAWAVSDFWLSQGLAYGELWLRPEDRAAQRALYESLARTVTRPKLLVLLDAPASELRRRIAARGRPYEQALSDALLDQLRQNIARTAATEYEGPVLKLSTLDPQAVVDEVAAAIAGMSNGPHSEGEEERNDE
jgi:2-amino-4-hydroxy-6-hydroxymethyldihydropteridine diphosphokinase